MEDSNDIARTAPQESEVCHGFLSACTSKLCNLLLFGSNLACYFSSAGAPLIDHLFLFVLIQLILLLISCLILRQIDLALKVNTYFTFFHLFLLFHAFSRFFSLNK